MNIGRLLSRARTLGRATPIQEADSWEQRHADDRAMASYHLELLKSLGVPGARPEPPPPDVVARWEARRAKLPHVTREEALAALRRACPEPPGGWVKR